jgi:hypothetical protein
MGERWSGAFFMFPNPAFRCGFVRNFRGPLGRAWFSPFPSDTNNGSASGWTLGRATKPGEKS